MTVDTLKNKLYMFRFLPKATTYVSYTNGKGEKRELHSHENGELAVYEPDGIAGSGAAGIGTGEYGNYGAAGFITINGGSVTATTSNGGQAIGGGANGGNCTVKYDSNFTVMAGANEAEATDVTDMFAQNHSYQWAQFTYVEPNDGFYAVGTMNDRKIKSKFMFKLNNYLAEFDVPHDIGKYVIRNS